MIQRIQSLFLLGAGICFAVACFLPVGTLTTAEAQYIFTSWSLKEGIPDGAIVFQTFYIGLLQAILSILSLVAFFLFKKRPAQSKVCIAAIVINFILIFLMLLLYPETILPKFFSGELQYSPFALLSVVPLAFLYFANKFIIRDEKKVRAAERIR
jgi:hypothetical protein